MKNYQDLTRTELNSENMKTKISRYLVLSLLAFFTSCGEPETIVTNIVHPDGSVTRRLEMRNSKNEFDVDKIQVPFDTTWLVRDSVELNENGDTTWVRRAEKYYSGIDEINAAYVSDSGANRMVKRKAAFERKFRWFNTEFRYSETIDKTFKFGYPVSDFLSGEELVWFYNQGNMAVLNMESFKPLYNNGLLDSLKFNAMDSLVKAKAEEWSLRNIISEWNGTFSELIAPEDSGSLNPETLSKKESVMYEMITKDEDSFDKLWEDGTILRKYLGEEAAEKYRIEADSALGLVTDKFLVSFSDYALKMSMPGKILGGNGLADSAGCQVWNVKSDFFMTEPYIMYAESKVTNWWAWVISGLFILFVISGVVFRKMQKG